MIKYIKSVYFSQLTDYNRTYIFFILTERETWRRFIEIVKN